MRTPTLWVVVERTPTGERLALDGSQSVGRFSTQRAEAQTWANDLGPNFAVKPMRVALAMGGTEAPKGTP